MSEVRVMYKTKEPSEKRKPFYVSSREITLLRFIRYWQNRGHHKITLNVPEMTWEIEQTS